MPEKPKTPEELATENLMRICVNTGASYSSDHVAWSPLEAPGYPGPWVRIALGDATYYISVGWVVRTRGILAPVRFYERTCVHFVDDAGRAMPHSEHVANALLLLKNNPALFDAWKRHDGPHA